MFNYPKKNNNEMSRGEIKNILLALDESGESNKGLDKAIFIAKLSGAKITGVNVVVVVPTLVSTVLNYRNFLLKKAQKMLDSTKKTCEKQEIHFASKVLQGSPASKIAEFAEKGKFDLVIIGSRGLGGIKGAILGSVANQLCTNQKFQFWL